MTSQEPRDLLARLEAGEKLRFCDGCGHASKLLVCCGELTGPFPFTAEELRRDLEADELLGQLGPNEGLPC